jgi:hypothetical protein
MNVSTRGRIARLILPLLFAGLLASSCAGHIGYGVLNWSVPEYGLTAGDIVPVFIQSNIGKVYVVGVGKGNRKRIELPLWELTLRKSKSQAKKYADGLREYRYMYASVKLDGLPMRAEPENTARQVYRLKEGQKIKILKKGAGTPVLVGSTALDGDWLEVMADDGTTGWCFSYNLTVFDERESPSSSIAATAAGPDTALEALLGQSWYPDSLRLMVEANRVDIDRIDPQWGFFPGKDAGVARLVSGEGTVTFPYSTIERGDNGTYRFIGSSLTVQVRRQDTILVQYTDANGMPQAAYFAALSTAPDAIIQAERDRRDAILEKIRKSGPRFASGNYGALRFLAGGKFSWDGWQLLSPAIIPADAGSVGTVDVRCFLDPALAANYDGVLSFRFEPKAAWIHFLYTLSADGLKLEYVSESGIKDSVVTTRNLTPTVVFLKPQKADGQ